MPSIAMVFSEQSTLPTAKCECDDCLNVTTSRMESTRIAMAKCKCHPCVLKGKQMAERVAKPWELVTLAEYEGDHYSKGKGSKYTAPLKYLLAFSEMNEIFRVSSLDTV